MRNRRINKVKEHIRNLKVEAKLKTDNDTVYDSIFSAGGAYFNISDPVECEGDYGSVVSGDRIYSGIRDTDS